MFIIYIGSMDLTTYSMRRCGVGPIAMKMSWTKKNPRHKFLCCPNKRNGCNFFEWVKDDSSTSATSKSTEEERKDCKLCIVWETSTMEISSMAKDEIMFQHRLNYILVFINTLLVMVIVILLMKWPFCCKELMIMETKSFTNLWNEQILLIW